MMWLDDRINVNVEFTWVKIRLHKSKFVFIIYDSNKKLIN